MACYKSKHCNTYDDGWHCICFIIKCFLYYVYNKRLSKSIWQQALFKPDSEREKENKTQIVEKSRQKKPKMKEKRVNMDS